MPSKEQYKALIEPVGFSKSEMVEENKDRYFSDTDEMIKWIDQPSIVPFIKCIPDNMKESFRREVIQLMFEKTKQKDVAVADVFDALTSKCCYKNAMPLEKAYAIIREESGTHFAPAVVEAFFFTVVVI